jgi:hypothetical protein
VRERGREREPELGCCAKEKVNAIPYFVEVLVVCISTAVMRDVQA